MVELLGMMAVGLFIGRFAPLHRGHLLMMKECAEKVERLVVALGSADATPSCKNPFTVDERAEMVRRGMKEIGVANYEIVELRDCERDEEWIKELQEVVGKFDMAWSGSTWIQRVFKEHGLPIEPIKEFPGLSGTKIRKKMAQGLPWLKFVPLSVRKYLREIRAVRRARALCFGSVSTTDKKV